MAGSAVNPQDIYNYLRVRWGLSEAAAAGVLINIQYESSFNSGAEGDKDLPGSSWGLFQHRGPRWRRLQAYAAAHGSTWSNWQTQVDFAMEGKGEALELGFDIHATSAYSAAFWWTTVFERPANAQAKGRERGNAANNYLLGDPGTVSNVDPGTGNAAPGANQEVLNLPTGGSWFRVGNQYYVAYRFYGNEDKTGPSQVVYYLATIPPPAGEYIHSEASWNKWHANWVDAGSMDALRGIPEGTSYQDLVNDMLMSMGMLGSAALQDSGVLAIIALAMTRDMTAAELQNRLQQTEWWNNHTNKDREWNDLSDAEKNLRIANAASELAGLWFTYVGEDLNISQYDTDGDGIVSADELQAGNPDLFLWATRLASGELSDVAVVNNWIKAEALLVDESPWERTLRQEEQEKGQHAVDVSNMVGRIKDLYNDWGMPITDEQADILATQVIMNQVSFEDVQDELQTAAQGMYPHKPPNMSTRDWANPYMTTMMNTLEIPQMDLTDPTLSAALAEGMNLADFTQMLRDDDRWLETANARTEMNSKISGLGRVMGF